MYTYISAELNRLIDDACVIANYDMHVFMCGATYDWCETKIGHKTEKCIKIVYLYCIVYVTDLWQEMSHWHFIYLFKSNIHMTYDRKYNKVVIF